MTKEEFMTQFNSLITSDNSDALAIENFRNSVCADYDALTTAQTAVTSFTAKNESLSQENAQLKETNLKLIMLHPESINSNFQNSSKDDTDTLPKELTDSEKQDAINEVLKGFGHKF